MTAYIAISSMAKTPREIESFKFIDTIYVGAKHSSIGDRLITVWSVTSHEQAVIQAVKLWDALIGARIVDSLDELESHINSFLETIPLSWR